MNPVPVNPRTAGNVLLMLIFPGKHVQDPDNFLLLYGMKRPGGPEQIHDVRKLPVFRTGHGNQMLRYDIQCIFRHFARFNVLIHHFPGNNDTVQQIPAGPWYNPPFADSIQPVPGTAQPLHSPCDGFGRSDLEDQIDIPDIDSQLQGGCGDKAGDFPGLQLLFHFQPGFPGDAAMVGPGNGFSCNEVEIGSNLFRSGPVVHKDKRGFMLPDIPVDGLTDGRPDTSFFQHPIIMDRHNHLQIHFFLSVRRHHGNRPVFPAILLPHAPSQEPGSCFQGANGGRQADPDEIPACKMPQTLQGKSQMDAPFIVQQGMDLVHNDITDALQNTPGLFRSQQKVQGFRCGDQDMRRPAQHFLTIPGWCVPCAHSLGNGRKGNFAVCAFLFNPFQRQLQIAVNVIVQSLQRRDVKHIGPVPEGPLQALFQ